MFLRPLLILGISPFLPLLPTTVPWSPNLPPYPLSGFLLIGCLRRLAPMGRWVNLAQLGKWEGKRDRWVCPSECHGFGLGIQVNMFKDGYESNMGSCFTTAFYLPGETRLRGSCGHSGTHWSVSPKRERAWGEGNGSQGVKVSQKRTTQKRRTIRGKVWGLWVISHYNGQRSRWRMIWKPPGWMKAWRYECITV